jgi:monofunctional biosynthetic peptidoglycan transglycosylase
MSKAARTAMSKRRVVLWCVFLPLMIVFAVQLYFFLMVCWYAQFNPRQSTMMSDQLAALRAKNPRAELKYEWVAYERISPHLKRAVIASEDANFADHDGVDWEALQKAYERNNKRHKVVGGGSTITQQLAKNLFLSGSRSYVRKGQELIIAFMLETVLSKQRILELYLNVVEYGRGIFGAEAAARYYYRTSAAGLGAAQAARLAVMLPNPRYYDKHRDTSYLARRTGLILRRMAASDVP